MENYGKLNELKNAIPDGVVVMGIYLGWEFKLLGCEYTNSYKDYGEFHLTLYVPKDQYPMYHRHMFSKEKEYLKDGLASILNYNRETIISVENGEIHIKWILPIATEAESILEWIAGDIEDLYFYWMKCNGEG